MLLFLFLRNEIETVFFWSIILSFLPRKYENTIKMDLWRRELFLLVLFYMCVFACGHSVVACQGLATTPVVLLSGFSPLHNPSRVKMVVLYELIPVALGWVRDMEMRISDLYTI